MSNCIQEKQNRSQSSCRVTIFRSGMSSTKAGGDRRELLEWQLGPVVGILDYMERYRKWDSLGSQGHLKFTLSLSTTLSSYRVTSLELNKFSDSMYATWLYVRYILGLWISLSEHQFITFVQRDGLPLVIYISAKAEKRGVVCQGNCHEKFHIHERRKWKVA